MSIRTIWAIHFTTLIALIIWSATDPAFETMVQMHSLADATSHVGLVRIAGFLFVVLLAVGSLIVLFMRLLGLAHSTAKHRSVRQLVAITTVIALWFSLAIHHDSISWQGKRVRFASRIDVLESIASPLRANWPERDGELSAIGPFMAYPFGNPTTLVLLQAPRITSQSVYVSAIERCPCGAIKLQLTGTDGGDWAEWHPPQSHPSSFVGGLSDPHELRASAPIGGGWYLVRYQAS